MDPYADRNYRRLFDTEGEWYCDDARNIETGAMPDFDPVSYTHLSVPNGQKNAFLVQAILQSADSENLIEKIRMVFREELKGVQISPEKNMGKQEDGIPSQMLDFLSGMEENWE